MKTIIELMTAIIACIAALMNLKNDNSLSDEHKTMTEKTIPIIAIVVMFAMVIIAICYLSKKL